jgi:tRNA G37 N-methylase Trm5
MKDSLITVIVGAVLSIPLAAQKPPSQKLAPNVASPQLIVDRMLEAAALKPGEVVYDLGCGEGRIVITAAQKFHAKAIGVEISPGLVLSANEMIHKLGLVNRASVIRGDIMEVDIGSADVVTLYLLTSSNEMLRPRLEKMLRPGARVVSHDYPVKGWKPARIDEVKAHGRIHKIFVYEMPPRM